MVRIVKEESEMCTSPNRLLGNIFGAAYLLVGPLGIVGFFVSGPINVLALNVPDRIVQVSLHTVAESVSHGVGRRAIIPVGAIDIQEVLHDPPHPARLLASPPE